MDGETSSPGAAGLHAERHEFAEPALPPAAVVPRPAIFGTVLLALFGPLLAALSAAILVLFVAACLPGAPPTRELAKWSLRSAPGMAAQILLQNGLTVAWALWLARRRDGAARWLRLAPARFSVSDVFLFLLLAGGVFGAGVLAVQVGHRLGVPVDPAAVRSLEEVFRSAPGLSWLVLSVAMGVGPGFGEEIWFRGHVLRALESRLRTRWAIVLSALLFALLHLRPALIVFALPFGLVFGWLAIRTGSILPGILCHAVVNTGVNLPRAIAARRSHGDLGITPQVIGPQDVMFALGLLAAGAVALVLIERRFRTRDASDPVVETATASS